jgi:outer membrane biosynthesis protein TonB
VRRLIFAVFAALALTFAPRAAFAEEKTEATQVAESAVAEEKEETPETDESPKATEAVVSEETAETAESPETPEAPETIREQLTREYHLDEYDKKNLQPLTDERKEEILNAVTGKNSGADKAEPLKKPSGKRGNFAYILLGAGFVAFAAAFIKNKLNPGGD